MTQEMLFGNWNESSSRCSRICCSSVLLCWILRLIHSFDRDPKMKERNINMHLIFPLSPPFLQRSRPFWFSTQDKSGDCNLVNNGKKICELYGADSKLSMAGRETQFTSQMGVKIHRTINRPTFAPKIETAPKWLYTGMIDIQMHYNQTVIETNHVNNY